MSSASLASLAAGVLLLAGCAPIPTVSQDAPGPAVLAPAPTGGSAVRAEALLQGLVVRQRPRPDGSYQREVFGRAWADLDDNGCNQRDDVLLRDAVPGSVRVRRQGACDHDVLAGSWLDPYTGALLRFDDLKDPTQAQAVQIDHVVPLAEAWSSGAATWSDRRLAAYANDLDGLLAVDGPSNAAKGAGDPAAWRPRQSFQCSYAVRWIVTKHRWGLAVDEPEVRALRDLLATCPPVG